MATPVFTAALAAWLVLAGGMPGAAAASSSPLPRSISFPTLLLPSERNGVLTGNARFHVTLELADRKAHKRAEEQEARLQDAVLKVLFTAMIDKVIVNGSIENGAELRRRLDTATEEILGGGAVTRVLVFSAPQKP